ncbi:MAG: GTPase [Bacillus thermozeamaize]|uniref:GTPase n=1 Tax=Bacillus thermozeamaize TaxID=230954 RepID=A0A1Y3PCF7_9BACI|nr:MAG: GTPase [Bacillus thermozeamaize]
MTELQAFVRQILSGHKRSVARAISLVENEDPIKLPLLEALYPHTGTAYVLGITGSPGAGKSSLVDRLIQYLRGQGKQVGVLAVDPTSPYTGGALLGDRVRMVRHATDTGVYIRSMGTRGNLGGLSRSSREVIRILDACGCDVILVETVGVGQSELDVMHVADSVCVVLHPGAGDVVQAFKAGIMEIADLFVVNKSDLPGAENVVAEIEEMLDVSRKEAAWRPPVVKASSKEDRGIGEIWEAAEEHVRYLQESRLWDERRSQKAAEEVVEIARELILRDISARLEQLVPELSCIEEVRTRQRDPYSAARQVAEQLLGRLELG